LDFVHDRAEAIHVGRVDDEPHRIAKARTLGLGDQLHIHEGLADARLIPLDERIGLGIDAAHPSHVDEVPGPSSEIPGPGWLDGPRRRERLYAVRRDLLGRRGHREQEEGAQHEGTLHHVIFSRSEGRLSTLKRVSRRAWWMWPATGWCPRLPDSSTVPHSYTTRIDSRRSRVNISFGIIACTP